MATKNQTVQLHHNPHDEALRRLAQRHLHQSLRLPQTSSHDSLRVTFATTSNFGQHELPAILFIGPMFGSRYNALTFDKLAKTSGVRVICVDRPGIGGSTPVPLGQRMEVWLETVPLLLERLEVKHVTLLTHSAGTPFLMNTLLRHRDILDPAAPHVAFLGPWVHSQHSNKALLSALAKLPTGMISSWSEIVEFINLRVNPAALWSGGFFSSLSAIFSTEPDAASADLEGKYGDVETGKEIEKLQSKFMFAESMVGGNDEARLCLKSNGDGFVGACENYEQYVMVLLDHEKDRRRSRDDQAKLRVSLHFAESDMMSGKGGQEYFQKCWNQPGVKEAIEVHSKEYPGTNHETVLVDFEKGALRGLFEVVASRRVSG